MIMTTDDNDAAGGGDDVDDDDDAGDDDDGGDDDDDADAFANRWDYVPTNTTCLVGGLKHFHISRCWDNYPTPPHQ